MWKYLLAAVARLSWRMSGLRKDFEEGMKEQVDTSPDELPWSLAIDSEVWDQLIVPYLASTIELVLHDICGAVTDRELAVMQGKLAVLRDMQAAPGIYQYLKERRDALSTERIEKYETGTKRRRSRVRPIDGR